METLSKYLTVATTFLGSSETELKINPDHYQVKIEYQGRVYGVASYADIKKYSIAMLSIDTMSINIPLEIWVDVGEDLCMDHNYRPFYYGLFKSSEEKSWLDEIYHSYHSCDNIYTDFWRLIFEHENFEQLFPKAVTATLIIANLETIANELADCLIHNGQNYFTKDANGIFEEINLTEGKKQENFYIYSL